ncbi:MAG: RagB/SusD family nutrient uptake outer membrane protein [Bacteroidia bacterium]|nr:RagB/SusD family nutrient uptake outer membrane protein [Bacteroidia bacterium]
MKKKLSKIFITVFSVMICLSILSCSKMFDIEPKSAVSSEQMYRNVYDADAAVIGIYGKFLNVVDRYVILNELRSDLADVTPNSNQYLKQLSTHTVTVDNPYADPRPFYEVILNCNDALKNFDIMRSELKMTEDEYKQRYSDIGALRTWLYFQLGIQYGNIPYVTEPIENLRDLQNEAKFPRIGFDQLLNNLIQFTESLPFKYPYPTGSSLLSTYDTYYTEKIFINKNCLLGDLYLWKGSWTQAATAYREVVRVGGIPYNVVSPGEQYYEYYMLAYTANTNGGNWANIFRNPFGERYSNYEIMWNLPFDKNFNPKNPFIDLFSTSGSYLIKPSDLAINNWNAQLRNDNGTLPGTPTDIRGNGISYRMVGGLPEINKYTYNYSPLLPFETNGKVILYRGANLFLRFAEAANHDGRDRIAYCFLNDGISRNYDPVPGGGNSRDVTNIQQTRFGDYLTGPYETAPYYFDARVGDYPQFRNGWYRAVGLRSRTSNMNLAVDSTRSFNMAVRPRVVTNRVNLINDLDDLLIAESGLETAFEGNRWGDLLRIALRRKATDPNYLANKIGAKFDAAHSADAAAVRAKLTDPANWYLPFRWK